MNLSTRQHQQLTLAIKHGGFGLSGATETTSSAFLGAWANTLTNLPDREQRLSDICNALIEDFDSDDMTITRDLRDALVDLHNTGTSMIQVLPSLNQLTERPKHPDCNLSRKTSNSRISYSPVLAKKIVQGSSAVVAPWLGSGSRQFPVRRNSPFPMRSFVLQHLCD